jgi:hypothetical protein
MTSRDHARRLMLILLANDRAGLRLDQDAPTAHRAAGRDHQDSRGKRRAAAGARSTTKYAGRGGALVRAA